MRRTEALQGVRMIKFRSVFERYEASELNQIDAAALLGITERTFRRWCVRFEDGGEAGLLDRRLGQASGRRVPPERERQIETLYRTRYSGFTAKHFHEHLVRDHGSSWGYTWTKVFLQSKGLVPRAKTRGAHRRKRPRRPLPGMMLHQDGPRHEWIAGLDAMDLIVTMDDATNTIYSGFWCPRKFIRDVYVPAHNGEAGTGRLGVRGDHRDRSGRDLVCAGGTPGGQRQHRGVSHIAATDPAQSAACALCQIDREGAAVPRRQPRDLPRAAPHRPLRCAGRLANCGHGCGGMKRSQTAACGFMDTASALPTTPQAPHQPPKRKAYRLLRRTGFCEA